MKGFIKNETNNPVFKLQRGIPINGILNFDTAYLVLGDKSKKKEGPAFIKWLKENYFQDEGWVFYKEEGELFFPSKKETKKELKESAPDSPGPPEVVELPKPKTKVAPGKGAGRRLAKEKSVKASNVTAGEIISANINLAREMISKTKDRSTLKRALFLSNQFSHKEDHRRLIQGRLEEVY